MRYPTLRYLLLFSLLLGLWRLHAADAASGQPNIVYFMIDELGYYELSHMGHPDMRTPNIDRLAAEGTRFTQCLAGSSVCAPTRCSFLTGKHTGHATIRNNGGFDPLLPGEETVGNVLQRAGYAVGGFGKWGNGGRGTSGVPEKHGFDVFFGYYDQVHAHTFYPLYLIRNSEEVPLAGNTGHPREGKTFGHYLIVEEGKKFIRANKDRPFFAYMCWTPPHPIWNLPRDDPSWALYKDKPWPEDVRMYAAMVNMIDRQVGEVRALLEELGIAKNTFILFTGDNGGHEYFADEKHPRGFFGPNVNPKTGRDFRGGKTNLYEGGVRVSTIAHWPGHIAAGRVSDQLCYFPDFLPTFAELAHTAPLKDTDGISLVPELLGEKVAGRKQEQHRYLYWEITKHTAVRMGDWKAVRVGAGAEWELYNLASDPGETKDVASQHPDIVSQVKAFAAEAHRPMPAGEIYDRTLLEKDRNYLGSAEATAAFRKNNKG